MGTFSNDIKLARIIEPKEQRIENFFLWCCFQYFFFNIVHRWVDKYN